MKGRNAARQLWRTFRGLGLKDKITVEGTRKSQDKTSKTTTQEDQIFLRAAHLVYSKYSGDGVYKAAPLGIWDSEEVNRRKEQTKTKKGKKGLEMSKGYRPEYKSWVLKQDRVGPSGPSAIDFNSKGTFLHPRSLSDCRSRACRCLGDIGRESLGVTHEKRSSRCDEALVATGVDVRKKLFTSGLMTVEGQKNLAGQEQARDERRKEKGKEKEQDEGGESEEEDSDDEDGDDNDDSQGSGKQGSSRERTRLSGVNESTYRRFTLTDSALSTPVRTAQRDSQHQQVTSLSSSAHVEVSQGSLRPVETPTPAQGFDLHRLFCRVSIDRACPLTMADVNPILGELVLPQQFRPTQETTWKPQAATRGLIRQVRNSICPDGQ